MKVTVFKRKGLLKWFRASIDLGYTTASDIYDVEELCKQITKIFQDWDKK